MLATGERPRELKWYHAGPMLFGDWGTSRLYVLGLAFAFNGRASFWFVAAMCVLMIGVGWSYTTVCRLFPDGGGVYSAARQRSQLFAVVGVLLLCADYVVTASLSCLDAFHYIGIKEVRFLGLPLDAMATAATILAIGGLNVFGPSKSGFVAMLVALATIALTLVIALFCLPHLFSSAVRVASPAGLGWRQSWIGFTEIVLALSGVEAVANMTGIMVPPVERTARRTILPVLIEIVILNLILAAAMNALPDSILLERTPGGEELAHTGDMLKVIARQFVDPYVPHFSQAASVVFALLLLSAVNTALGALVSVQFMLSRDKELPKVFSGLNRYGMPQLPLVVAAVVPALIVLLFPRVEALADLYAIGVVGAIAINLGSISTNRKLEIKGHERALMLLLTVVLIAIEITIALVKPHARAFALVVLIVGLAGRLATIVSSKAIAISPTARKRYLALAGGSVAAGLGLAFLGDSHYDLFVFELPLMGPRMFQAGDLAFYLSAAVAGTIGFASLKTQSYRQALEAAAHAEPTEAPVRPKMLLPGSYPAKFRIMVPTQGNPKLIEFAFQECLTRQAELQILFVRLLAVTPMGPLAVPRLVEDQDAQALFERVRDQARTAGVPVRLLYAVASDIPDAILDMAVTHGADLLLLGTTRRGALWKVMKGDVIQAVAEQLPEQVGLLIHA